eukprot:CAMPEP_0119062864 /NCGR_PEP_ID=MMETSP1178-20130426/6357_1 /TAXON_ID=33656 /ORGANISM="unid sp, Strain CCMP2000" /LENGTH=71 /DNA_ID=CAMNT_0007044173 /DNA_START=219 /DNA_END=434 /DNA_ORIENTATION=-
MRKMSKQGEFSSRDMPSEVMHAGPRLHGHGKQWWSGAGAAAGRPPIDELSAAGAAQLAPVALWTDDVLYFV